MSVGSSAHPKAEYPARISPEGCIKRVRREAECHKVLDSLLHRAERERAPKQELVFHKAIGSLYIESSPGRKGVHVRRDIDVLVAERDGDDGVDVRIEPVGAD